MSLESRLSGHALFQAFTREEMERLGAFSSVMSFGAGAVIYRHQQAASHIYVLLQGAVQLQRPDFIGDIPLFMARVTTGELLGLSVWIGYDRYAATARTTEPSDILAVEVRPFRALLDENPRAAAMVYHKLAQTYHSRYMETLLSMQGMVGQLPISL